MTTNSGSTLRKKAGVAALAVSLVGGAEGLRQVAYRDSANIPTACYGETKNIRMGMKFTLYECNALLVQSLYLADDAVERCVKKYLPDTRRVALISFTYNVGAAAFCSSTLVRKLNAGDIIGACDQIPRWNKITVAGVSVPLPGLSNRREVERQWCMKGLT